MLDLFSDDMRRNPYPDCDVVRAHSPVCHLAAFDLRAIFNYEGVKRALADHDAFSSNLSRAAGQGNPDGQVIPAGKLVLPMIGSAYRDPGRFPDAGRFDIARTPNPHLAFGLGIHACLGAPLARMEARIALADLLERLDDLELATDEPWEPRQAQSVHGPSRLPICFRRAGAPVQ
jgi:cytochrome P450